MLQRDFTLFESTLCNGITTPWGFISISYRSLKAQAWKISMMFQKAWNLDCNISDGGKVWPLVWSSPLFKSKSLLIKLQFVKTIECWYLTPRCISLFSKSTSPLCWKGCGRMAHSFTAYGLARI